MHPSLLKTIAVLICVIGLCENTGNQRINTAVILNTGNDQGRNRGKEKKIKNKNIFTEQIAGILMH